MKPTNFWFVVSILLAVSLFVVTVNNESIKQTSEKVTENVEKTTGTKPVETKSEPKRADSKETGSKPTDSKSKQDDPKSTGTNPKKVEPKSTDSKPVQTKADSKSTGTKPVKSESKQADPKSTGTKPVKSQPKQADPKSTGTKLKKAAPKATGTNTKKVEPKPAETKPVQSEPKKADLKSAETKPTESILKKTEPKPTETKPVELKSEPKITETKSTDSESKQKLSLSPETKPGDTGSSESLPPSPLPLSSPLFTINLQKYTESSHHSPLYELNLLIRSLQLEFNLILQQQQSDLIENSIPERYRTVYRIESYQRHWNPSQTLSGTVNITSLTPLDTILSLDRLLETGANWTDLEINLSNVNENVNKTLVFNAIVGKDSSSFDTNSKQIYKVTALFKFGKVLFDYRLNVEWQPKRDANDLNPCPWINLHHKLKTEPIGLLDFESFVDHSCPDGDQMSIEIKLSSKRWALANFHLKQSFNFGANGDELMKAIHPLFELVISGMWHSSIYTKTFDFKLTDIGQTVLSERMPDLFRAVYSRHQLDHENLYTVNIVKSNQNSPALLSSLKQRAGQSSSPTFNLLLPSNLIVIVTGSIASTTVIVFSLLGAFLSVGLSLIEASVIRIASQIELPADMMAGLPEIDHNYQIALQITATTLMLILLTLITVRSFPVLFRILQILVILLFIMVYLLTLSLRLLEMFPNYKQTLLLLP